MRRPASRAQRQAGRGRVSWHCRCTGVYGRMGACVWRGWGGGMGGGACARCGASHRTVQDATNRCRRALVLMITIKMNAFSSIRILRARQRIGSESPAARATPARALASGAPARAGGVGMSSPMEEARRTLLTPEEIAAARHSPGSASRCGRARARARRAEVGRARTRRARGLLTGGARRGSCASRRGAARRHRRRSGHCTRVSVAVVVPRPSRSRLGARRVRGARQCRAPRRRGLPIAGSTTRTPCTRPREQETWKECGRFYLLQLGI